MPSSKLRKAGADPAIWEDTSPSYLTRCPTNIRERKAGKEMHKYVVKPNLSLPSDSPPEYEVVKVDINNDNDPVMQDMEDKIKRQVNMSEEEMLKELRLRGAQAMSILVDKHKVSEKSIAKQLRGRLVLDRLTPSGDGKPESYHFNEDYPKVALRYAEELCNAVTD